MNSDRDEKKILNFIRYLPIVFIIIVFVIVTNTTLYQKNENFKNEIKSIENLYLKKNKDHSKDVIERIYKQIKIDISNLQHKNSENELKEFFLKRIENISFGKNGYVFVYNLDGICLTHLKKDFIGLNMLNIKNKNGDYVIRDILDFAKRNKEGFFSYTATMKPSGSIKKLEKISYVKLIDDWDWVIGTGFYLDSLENQINIQKEHLVESNDESIITLGYITFLAIVLSLIFSYYFSRYIQKIFLRYQTKIKSQNEILLKAQEVAKIGDWKLNLKTNKVVWSNSFIRIFGLNDKDRDEFGPEYLKQMMIAEDIPCFEDSMSKCINTQIEHHCVYRIKRPDHTIAWIECRGEINEDQSFIIGTAQDITDKQNYLKELEQKKKELETIIQNAPNPMILHEEGGKILMLNQAWLDYSGYSADDAPSTYKWVESIYDNEETIVLVKKHIDSLYKITEKVDEGDFTFYNKNKELITWQFSSAPLGKVHEKRTIITSAMDITELKRKDEMLLHQSRHAAMGEMISMIAHQWRQPLSTISMDANNMLLNIALKDLSLSATKEYATNILGQTQHLSSTIDDFRNFFKPDKVISKVDIKEILTQTLSIVQDSLANHNIELTSTFETQTQVSAYPRELMQVFVNIITNAKDALVADKIKDAKINIKVYEDNKYINTDISDNAGGIEAKILSKIFDPYFSTKDEKNGTGLGLYMSKMIIEDHLHGIIEVHNNDVGVCFRIRLLK